MASLSQKKVFASLPRTERGKPVRITGDPKHGKNFLYCNGNSVYIRNLKDPLQVDIYTGHSKPATIARYSPSGFYIASGDVTGKIRIWDTINPEHILKAEYPVLGGELCDVAWCPDSKKIAVCGQGREKFAHVFNMDTGTSAGEIGGHTKAINTISYRPRRPFRMVTASEDMTLRFFEGPPFKAKRSQSDKHTNFVNVAKFSGDGNIVLSAGSDGQLLKFDGDNLEAAENMELGKHKGGIYDLCFSADNMEVLTASGDKTAKIFNLESGEEVCVFDMNKGPGNLWQNMQLGCLWQDGEIVTVNGYGHITYHDRNNPDQPKRVIKGHMKPITALAVSEDKTTAFTGGQEGIVYWDVESGDSDTVCGKGHSNEVTDMVVDGDNLYSVGVDDTLRVTSVSDKDFSDTEIKLDSQPKAVDSKNGMVAVACINHLIVFEAESGAKGKGGSKLKKKSMVDLKPTPASISIHPDGSSIAVGFQENMVTIYSLQTLSEQKKIKLDGEVSCLAYSPDGQRLAYGASKKVGALSTSDYERVGSESEKHTARVRCLGWSPDSQRFATGSLDSFMIVWKADMPFETTKPSIKAHTMSHINKLAWLDPCTIITAGQDSNVKQFTLDDGQQAKC